MRECRPRCGCSLPRATGSNWSVAGGSSPTPSSPTPNPRVSFSCPLSSLPTPIRSVRACPPSRRFTPGCVHAAARGWRSGLWGRAAGTLPLPGVGTGAPAPPVQLTDPGAFGARVPAFAAFHAWLRARSGEGVEIVACGASVLHLAAAGLLDGRLCAAGPRLVGPLRRLFPRVQVDTDNVIRRAGHLWTCSRDAESAALIARMFAEAFSLTFGRSLAAREPPGPQAGPLAAATDPFVARAQLWIRDRFTQRFRIADLARDLGVSHQSLIRRFRAAGSSGPREFVQRTRVDAAMSMLAETRRSVTEIAQLVGYADVPSFRRVFVATTGVSPNAWRSEEHTSELQSLMRTSYAVFCLNKK